MAFKKPKPAAEPFPGGRQLRDYQLEAVAAVQSDWADGLLRPSVVMATGLGKSTVLAKLAADHVEQPHGVVNGKLEQRRKRVLFLAHRHELLGQLRDSVLAVRPGTSVGIVQADRNEVDHDVVVASIQTLFKPERLAQVKDVGMVIVDECHHAVSRTYMETLGQLGCFSDTIAVGVTATMDRLDQKKLADVWEAVSYSKGIRAGIAEGHLVMPVGKAVVIDSLDLSEVKTSKGDYQEGQLGEAVQNAVVDIAKAVAVHTAGRTRRIVFVPTVLAASDLADELELEGLNPAVVVGTTPKEQRQATYKALRDNTIDTIVSVGVLTEGFDLPAIDCVVMARPTQSSSLYQQCIGRGLRPSQDTGKVDCLVLDICEANRVHTLQTLDKLVKDAKYKRVNQHGDELADPVEYEDEEPMDEAAAVQLEGTLVDRDLFGDSAAIWLRTDKGIRFLPAGDWLMFLWPVDSQDDIDSDTDEDTDRYQVGCISSKGSIAGGWVDVSGVLRQANDPALVAPAELELTHAKARAEALALDIDPSLSQKAAPWRKGNRAPSEAQVKFASRLGIHSPETKTKARLSDDISQKLASARLDV